MSFVTPLPLNARVMTAYLADVSTAGQIYVVSPFTGVLREIHTALNGPITAGNAVITVKIAGTAVTGGTITIAQSGSAAGDVDSAYPTAANTVRRGQVIEIETDGGSTDTAAAMVTLVILE